MADTDVWGLGGPIASPAATDRLPWATGPLAGGYSVRGDFLWKDASGRYQIGSDGSAANPALAFGADLNTGFYRPGTDSIGIVTAGTESVRIDASGNFGINCVPLSVTRFQASLGTNRRFTAFANGAENVLGYLNDAGSWIDTMVSGATLRLAISGVERWRIASTFHILPAADNSYDFGSAAFRGRVAYFGTGTINTSDGDEKTEKRAFTAAELLAAKRIAATIGIFQFLDAVAEKGEAGARLHIGVIAQEVWAIMADEGLISALTEGEEPSCRYAFLCHDAWEATPPVPAVDEVRDEAGNVTVIGAPAKPGREAGKRFGIRPDQLALFLIAAQEARIAALEAA